MFSKIQKNKTSVLCCKSVCDFHKYCFVSPTCFNLNSNCFCLNKLFKSKYNSLLLPASCLDQSQLTFSSNILFKIKHKLILLCPSCLNFNIKFPRQRRRNLNEYECLCLFLTQKIFCFSFPPFWIQRSF